MQLEVQGWRRSAVLPPRASPRPGLEQARTWFVLSSRRHQVYHAPVCWNTVYTRVPSCAPTIHTAYVTNVGFGRRIWHRVLCKGCSSSTHAQRVHRSARRPPIEGIVGRVGEPARQARCRAARRPRRRLCRCASGPCAGEALVAKNVEAV